MRKLDDWFGVTGKALDWFKSHLTGRCQRIKLGDSLSSKADFTFGVPQRSDLGHLLFTLYTAPLSSMISGQAIPHHLYDDNSRLYVSFASGDYAAALKGLQSYLASFQSWMLMTKLKLNPDKTEFLLIGNERQQSKYHYMFSIELFGVKTHHHMWRIHCLDIASSPFLQKSTLSLASLPASVVVVPSQSPISCSYLLVCVPLQLLPSTLASNMCFSGFDAAWCVQGSSVFCLLMLCLMLDAYFFKISSFVTFSFHEIRSIFL